MKEINKLLQKLKEEKEKYKESPQLPVKSNELILLKNKFKKMINEELEDFYIKIIEVTNGFDNDGVILYASHKTLIEGYDNRFIEGIIEANKIWHQDSNKSKFIFYAESELYLFFKSIEDGKFYCVYRDDIETIIFKTNDKVSFFSSIIKLSLGEYFE